MTQMTQDQRDALRAAGWTEAEATGFAQALTTFRDGLPPRQRDAFTAILATAGAAADTQGHMIAQDRLQPSPAVPTGGDPARIITGTGQNLVTLLRPLRPYLPF